MRIDKKTLLNSIAAPMGRYHRVMVRDFTDWQPLEDAAECLLQGREVQVDTLIPPFRPLLKMMQLIMERRREAVVLHHWIAAESVVASVVAGIRGCRLRITFQPQQVSGNGPPVLPVLDFDRISER